MIPKGPPVPFGANSLPGISCLQVMNLAFGSAGPAVFVGFREVS
jgi:hypothetical protein